MKFAKRIPLCVSLALGLSAAHAFAADPTTTSETMKKAGETAAPKADTAVEKNTVKIDFQQGSAKLTESEISSLRSLVKSAQTDGKIAKVYVGAWSDKSFTEGKKPEYTEADKELAKERAKSIKNVLDEAGVRDVEVVNLAEKPNWFEEKMGTEKSKIKDTMAGKEASERTKEDREMAAIGETMKSEGGASKAVIIVQPKVAH